MNAPSPTTTPRPIRTAATLILLRDGADGMEVLLLRRADKTDDQNSGACVFPGGVVDTHDRSLHRMCRGLDDRRASERLGVAEGGLDYYAAAVRECFEEAGVLFASDAGDRLVALDQLPPGRLAAMRHAAEQGTDALLALCEAEGWQLAVDRLAYFSHWLTPPGMPRRFDTRFFVAQMPPGQRVQPDGRETVEHLWLRPAEAASARRGLKLMNVTRRTLEQLAGFARADECMAYARALARMPLNMPRLADGPGGRRAVNIDEAAYEEIGLVDPDGTGHGGRARYALSPGLATQLSARIRRVAGDGGDAGPHSYFVGSEEGPLALIDPAPPGSAAADALRAAAPGPVRWLLSTAPRTPAAAEALTHWQSAWPGASAAWPAPRESIALGGATLKVVPGAEGAPRQFLLAEERTLFTGTADPAPGTGAEWIAPARGFLFRASRAQP
ncbi:8-oxo-dGTP pyrophosphatase MutT (NUDIX family) [Variovorax sp. TBS-050B]|uniref:NUDIX hydrolase n=1 Tax=Variovorax sp. TBS-050B TaxID=2940551 RepID=UPI002473A845|nr:NUDIX domain-containing protein [Variovorax sp. TBS-050B]MDH6594987.1 8-oxo-dGTP pyrophosphatase MutT (NUDIX family) [Variovorax sp. TBS-050B]